MISKEEFLKIQVGDRVKIVSEWTSLTEENDIGKMDYLLGSIVKINGRINSEKIKIDASEESVFLPRWVLNRHCIEKRIEKTPILTF